MAHSSLQHWHGSMNVRVAGATRGKLPANARPVVFGPVLAHKLDHSDLAPQLLDNDIANHNQILSSKPEFVYTTIALKTGGRMKKQRAYARATGSVKGSRQQKPSAGSSYRAFESLQGSALPLMMISADTAATQQEENPEVQQVQPKQRRTHRRCFNINKQNSTVQPVPDVVHDAVNQASFHDLQLVENPEPANHFTLLPPVDQTIQCAQMKQSAKSNLQVDSQPPNVLRQQVEDHLQACCKVLNIRHGKTLSSMHSLQTVLLRIPSPALLPQQMLSLSRLLHLPYHAIREMVKMHPQLLLHNIDDIENHALQIAALMHGPDATIHDVKSTLKLNPALLTTAHTAEQALLGIARHLQPIIGMSNVHKLIVSCPDILAHPAAPSGQNFTAVLSILAQELECSQVQVSHACSKHLPHILMQSPAAIQGCCTAVRIAWGLDAQQLHQLVGARPQLLLMSPGTAQVVARTTRKLIGKSKYWRADIKLLLEKPPMLAKLLSFNSARLSRLAYLVSTRRDTGIHWSGALTMPDSDWNDMYPAYQTWLRQQGR